METPIRANITRITENIRKKALLCGRNADDIKLMAVTKTVADDRIIEALDAGITVIGENYVQEALRKKENPELAQKSAEWHMIGHLQTNKAKYVVRLFDMIQSVDRLELAVELDKRSRAIGKITRILIEIDTGGEVTKSGVSEEAAIDLIKAVAPLENLAIEGLMTIPPWFDDPEDARPYFVALRKLKEKIESAAIPRISMKELSMGMTDDYLVAIEEGATIVRIGRGIFGERAAKY